MGVTLAAVSIGAAAVVATGSLVESTLASFEASVRRVASDADLRVANGFVGVPQDLAPRIAELPGVAAAAPILTARVRAEGADGFREDLLLVGIDLLGEDALHGGAVGRDEIEVRDPLDFVARPEAVALAREWAGARGLAPGSTLRVHTRAGPRELFVAGLVPRGATPELLGGSVGVMDLPALQVLLGREGIVDAIDVRVASGAELDRVRRRVEEAVAGAGWVSPASSGGFDRLLFNLRLILHIAGFMAIVVSILVIYHAVAVFVSQRQGELHVIRSLGASSRSVTAMLGFEALGLGVLGGAIGAALGAGLAAAAHGLFASSVTTLYTDLAARTLRIAPGYVALGLALAVVVSLLATAVALPRRRDLGGALVGATPRRERLLWARRAGVLGLALVALSLGLGGLQRPDLAADRLILLATSADVLLLAGVSLASPWLVLGLSPRIERALRHRRSPLPRLAWQGVAMDPGRTAAVLGSILVGLSYVVITIAVVGSLSAYVFGWVERSFRADLVVSARGSLGILPASPAIPRSLGDALRDHPGVARVEGLRVVTQPYGERWIVVAARDVASFGESYPVQVTRGDLARARRAMRQGTGVLASVHFAEKFGLAPGDPVELRTPSGPVRFRLAAVVDDFLTDLGTVYVAPETYRRLWRDDAVNGFHVWLHPGAAAPHVRAGLAERAGTECDCAVTDGAAFRGGFQRMIDAAFQSAYALEVVAAVVTVISVASFFALTLSERRREIHALHTIGATRRQLVGALLAEAAALGLLGGLLGLAAGVLVSYRLVHTTMHASGGLRIDYLLPLWTVPALVLGAIGLSVLSSLRPVLRFTAPAMAAEPGGFDE